MCLENIRKIWTGEVEKSGEFALDYVVDGDIDEVKSASYCATETCWVRTFSV